ncbi:hypothetical protein PHSY_005317 [Pseudozyma hubeiensis SY62]|uniref:Uncharacterized protein n=1 Tax=Pseudozyma hubeiensis (strain SY62) TaxID=1305764 RepID=R9PI02_PSEHS|nr:hypothetical protein PHSY_005317 [Pseudozyma hubeiensis SY62]GAC97730.1 hypothetical protein PHSY_005317 [Pseudozyma hubeiensis SY62]
MRASDVFSRSFAVRIASSLVPPRAPVTLRGHDGLRSFFVGSCLYCVPPSLAAAVAFASTIDITIRHRQSQQRSDHPRIVHV